MKNEPRIKNKNVEWVKFSWPGSLLVMVALREILREGKPYPGPRGHAKDSPPRHPLIYSSAFNTDLDV